MKALVYRGPGLSARGSCEAASPGARRRDRQDGQDHHLRHRSAHPQRRRPDLQALAAFGHEGVGGTVDSVGAGLPHSSMDDTLFNPGSTGEMLVTDQQTGNIYQVTVPGGSSAQAFSAAQNIGQLGTTNLTTGLFTPVISGLGSPRGLAFLNAGAFTDLSNYTLVDPSTDPQGPNDPNLINDTTTNVLLTEKYDDLKVQAILNEIKGLPSHTFFGSDKSQIPAIFGMNFQAVSVAQKDCARRHRPAA